MAAGHACRAADGEEAASGLKESHLGVLRHDADVRPQRHLGSAAERVAVDGRDDGLEDLNAGIGVQALIGNLRGRRRLLVGGVLLGLPAKIEAGGEGPLTCARQDEHPRVIVIAELADVAKHGLVAVQRQGVQRLRPVHRNQPDVIRRRRIHNLRLCVFLGHLLPPGVISAPLPRPTDTASRDGLRPAFEEALADYSPTTAAVRKRR